MAITDLTNTKWRFNDTVETPNGGFEVNFQTKDGASWVYLFIGYAMIAYESESDARYAYSGGTWDSDNMKEIHIIDGTDVRNSDFINWLSSNATQITPIREVGPFLSKIADAIRAKKGTTDKINAQDFATEIENLPSGADEEEIYNELLRTNFGDNSIVDDKTSYEQGYEDGSADALKDVTTLKGYLDITKSTANSFKNYTGTSVEGLIKYDDTSEVTNMENMFNSCTNLTTIPALNTSKVTSMTYMFRGCSSLTTIPLLDTSNVTSMTYIFYNCKNLTTIPLLDTSKITNMQQVFSGCSSLTTIPLLNTSNVTNMYEMFYNCKNLTTIPLLDTSKVTNMNYMFKECSSLTTIPALDTSNVTYITQMFFNCTNLTTIPALDTNKVTNMNSMFYNCKNLTTIPLLNTSKVTDMTSMFSGCSSLTTIPALDTSLTTNMQNMFFNCTNLTTIPALDTNKVTNMNNMFYNCKNLTTILMYGMKANFDISSSTKFEASDLVTILNNLATVTSTRTLTMGATNLAKLTDEQKAIATNKGWTLA